MIRVNDQLNLCQHLVHSVNMYPNEPAVAIQKRNFKSFSYQEMTFEQLQQKSDNAAYGLIQFGLKKGDKAVLMVNPSINFFIVVFALFKAGIIPILIDPGMGIKNLKQCFIDAEPDAFIGSGKAHLARWYFGWGKSTIKHKISVEKAGLFSDITLDAILKQYPLTDQFQMQQIDQQEMAAILFTSGNTGSPKGVIYTHQMFETQIELLKNEYHIHHGERDLATFPLFSLFGPALGMASIVPDINTSKPITADPDFIFAAISKYQCTNLFANPALIDILGNAGKKQCTKLTSIKRVISAGAPASLPAIKCFVKLLNQNVPLINSYGATESLPISKITSSELIQTEAVTNSGGGICVGKAVKNTSIKIIAITDSVIVDLDECKMLEKYDIGEIIVKGSQVAKQYYHSSQATNASKITDGDSFYHRMGDIGYLDKFNRLWMCGRKQHRVVTDNKTYNSISIERIFNTHPHVKRSALVGIERTNNVLPIICIEQLKTSKMSKPKLFYELRLIAKSTKQTEDLNDFLIHKNFPMDIRHNAKIFREKLAQWALNEIKTR